MGPQPIDASSTARSDEAGALDRWAAGGGLWLSGRPDGPPLRPPVGMVVELERIAASAEAGARALGGSIRLDPTRLLTARAADAALRRGGTISCGGATRLLAVTDGWVAVSLARPSDLDLVPAWLELDGPPPDDPWATVARVVATRSARASVDRARLLGLAAAVLGETAAPHATGMASLPVQATQVDPTGVAPALADLLVVDLGALWAGPLCGALLEEAGATVVKVESSTRPDGARQGPAAFFDRLNGGKRSAVLDLGAPPGLGLLHHVLRAADVVIEASRPRALAQLGIDPRDVLQDGPRVWVSITGHGRADPASTWVAFGDDAAVSGGLVCWEEGEPRFCADAVADPASGLVAFAATIDALRAGGRWLVDVPMAGVAAHLARGGPPDDDVEPLVATPPAPASPVAPSPPAGEGTTWLLERVHAT